MFLTLKKTQATTNICKGFLAIGVWPLNLNALACKMQPFKLFVDSEPKTQTRDLQDKKVLNNNINTPKGDICH
jgi:hypothetical protein